MASERTAGWQPEWTVAPGEILLEALEERGMTQSELAHRTARPLKTINEIVKGKAAITAETAIQLERALGISASVWTRLEAAYREGLARESACRELEENASWVDDFPLRDLVRHKLIKGSRAKAETLAQLLAYFRVSSPEAFERHWLNPQASFRSSPTFMASPKAVAAWLRWGEIEAAEVDAEPFDPDRFRLVLDQIRPLTRRGPFMQIFNRVRELCADAGVAVVLVPEFEGVRASGAARWIGGRPLIQLSLRHKSDDQFWFSFFHEAGHLLTSRRKEFIDAAERDDRDDRDEEKADAFARDALLPPNDFSEFVRRGDFGRSAVRAFAQQQQVAPGIVVGRLQRDRLLDPSHLNDLKKPIRWPRATR